MLRLKTFINGLWIFAAWVMVALFILGFFITLSEMMP